MPECRMDAYSPGICAQCKLSHPELTRCDACGAWLCPKCAKDHFAKTNVLTNATPRGTLTE